LIRLKVKEIAEQRGISQNKLSHLAVLDIKVVRKMFRDPTASFTTYALNKVAKALQVDIFDLIEIVPDDDA
jgi:DNA-binding Xre family transcriptional regulator